MLISEEYRKQNAELHETNSFYGVSGVKSFWVVKELVEKYGCKSVLDYGCGKANLSEKMKKLGVEVRNYDPCIPEFNVEPKSADLVVCTDVMEHVEPERVDEVLNHIKSLTKKAALFLIAFTPSRKFLPDGRNTHICIQTPDWWWVKLRERFYIKSEEEIDRGAIRYVVEPEWI